MPDQKPARSDPFDIFVAVHVRNGRELRPAVVDGHPDWVEADSSVLEAALDWQRQGARRLHLVDMDAMAGTGDNRRLFRDVTSALDVPVQVAGGICDEASLRAALGTGAERILLSAADPSTWPWVRDALRRFADQIVLEIPVRGTEVHLAGEPRAGTSRTAPAGVATLLGALREAGCRLVAITDLAALESGNQPDPAALRALCSAGLPVIVNGAITSMDGLRDVVKLRELGVLGAVVGKPFYDGRMSFDDSLQLVC